MFKHFGLTHRLLLGWLCQTLLIVLLFSFAMHESTEFMERNLISNILEEETLVLIDEMKSGEKLQIPSSISFYGDREGLERIPTRFQHLPDGYNEIVQPSESYFAYRYTANDGHNYLLLRDQFAFEQTEQLFKVVIVVSATLIFLCSLCFGYWWIRKKIMTPIQTISEAVQSMAQSRHYEPLKVAVDDDEVGNLAKTCDQALKQFHEALTREKLFTADVSHELRSPLTVIQTSSELLQLQSDDPKIQKYTGQILDASQGMNDLLSLFLQLARNAPLDNSQTDRVGDVLQRAVTHYKEAADAKKLELHFETEKSCPGHFSPVLLGTVANNLIKNAVTYTDEGSVTVRELDDGFEVFDTGPGLSQELQEKLFTPFNRGSSSKPGSGLGLSIAKRICDRCGWQIELVKQEYGTHFKVRLITNDYTSMDQRPNENLSVQKEGPRD